MDKSKRPLATTIVGGVLAALITIKELAEAGHGAIILLGVVRESSANGWRNMSVTLGTLWDVIVNLVLAVAVVTVAYHLFKSRSRILSLEAAALPALKAEVVKVADQMLMDRDQASKDRTDWQSRLYKLELTIQRLEPKP